MIQRKTLLLAIAILAVSFGSLAQGHDIRIQVADIEDSTAIIGYHFGSQKFVHDTLTFDDTNTLRLNGSESLPQGIYFVYSPGFYFEFLVGEQQFSLSTTLDGGYDLLEVSGSRENQLFKEFQVNMTKMQRKQRLLSDSLAKVSGADSISVRDELNKSIAESVRFRDKILKDNPNTFLASFIHMMAGISVPDFEEIEDQSERRKAQYEYYKMHYFDLVDSPGEMMRTPIFHNYVMKYFDELVLPQPDSLIKEIDLWLSRDNNEEFFRYWLVAFFKKYQESKIMGMDAIWIHLSEKYYLSGTVDWISAESLKDIEEEVRYIKPNLIGKNAPLLNVVDTTLQPFNLEMLDDEYLVIFFYDPDCGHCKKKTPVLKDNYATIKESGGEVLAVCTITDIQKWKDFINKNELDWINLGDPFGRSNFRVEYNVRTTPQLYVLDNDRKIVAKKLDVGDQLINFLQEHSRLNP